MFATSMTQLRTWATLAVLTLVLAAQAGAIDVTLTASDTLGNSSFNTAGNWSNGLAPSAGNDYFTSDFILRTPADGNSYTFAGDSLTVNNTTAYPTGLLYKGSGTTGVITVPNLILDGGIISHANGTADLFQLDGSINVLSDSSIYAKQGPIDVLADISGSATITNPGADNTPSILTFMSPDSTFTGSIVNNGRFTLDAGGVLNFVIGASGVNNSVTGAGPETNFNGVFDFDLAGASSNPGDSWTIAGAANQSFGETFSVAGFNQSGSFWSNGTYLFNPGTGVLSVAAPPVEWNTDVDNALFSVGSNWTGGVAPTNGDDALFGTVITGNRTVLLDTNTSLNRVAFSNTDGDYYLAPQASQTLTLTGEAAIDAVTGRHWVQVGVAGNEGLQKGGTGELILDVANSFTGGVRVADGRLSVTHPNAIPSGNSVDLVAASSNLLFGGDQGFFVDNGSVGGGYLGGTVNGVISGAGSVIVSNGATVTLSASNSYAGSTTVEDGRLTVANASALGAADGTAATGTTVAGGTATGTLALPGGVSLGGELLILGARQGAGSEAVHLSSSGNNTISSNIYGELGGTQYNIESTSGTLTLSGTISAPDSADREVVFSGNGDFNVAKIADGVRDAAGNITGAGVDNTISVRKRGTGTLTLTTTSATDADVWLGNTIIEEGTLRLTTLNTELRGSVVDVQNGGVLDVTAYTAYDLRPQQTLTGAGTVLAQDLGVADDNVISPGDGGVGTLNLNTTVTLFSVGGGGSFNFDLGNVNTVGGTENDLIAVSGQLTGTSSATFNIRPVEGALASGNYTLMTHNGGSPSFSGTVQAVDDQGNPLTIRQSLSIVPNSAPNPDQVNLVVAGSAANLTWNGTAGTNSWNVASTTNWLSGGSPSDFRDLDNVTFGSGGTKNVTINETVTPGSTTFSSNSTYTFTGTSGITGFGPVNVNAGTVNLNNTGNDYSGTTTVANGATLSMVSASTGTMVVNGTLQVGNGLTPEFSYTYVDASNPGNTTPDSAFASDNSNLDDNLWSERTGFASGGNVFQSGDGDGEDAPELTTTLTGLAPNTSYTVYVNFWDAGPAWQVRGGFTSGNTTLFANPGEAAAEGATAAVLASTLTYDASPTVFTEADRTMYAGLLGQGTTDASGNLTVFIDDKPSTIGVNNRTWYDGLSYSSGTTGGFTGGETLIVNGDFTMSSTSILELELAAGGFDSLDISGTATLGGIIDVSFLGAILPENGTAFTVLSADGGINTPLESLNFGAGLPANFTASYNDAMTELVLTFAAGLPGDFNDDGVVNLADYTVWRDNLGADDTVLPPGSTDDGSGIVDAGDYATWKANFGTAIAAGASTAVGAANVPEPSSWLLASLCGLAALAWRSRT